FVLMGPARPCGARRMPAHAQLRICQRCARARTLQYAHHPAPCAPQRHGCDLDFSSLLAEQLRDDRDSAWFLGFWPADGLAFSRRAFAEGKIELGSALARNNWICHHRADAFPSRLYWRGRKRRGRSKEDTAMSAFGSSHPVPPLKQREENANDTVLGD